MLFYIGNKHWGYLNQFLEDDGVLVSIVIVCKYPSFSGAEVSCVSRYTLPLILHTSGACQHERL